MSSKESFPEKHRLTPQQVIELEGFKAHKNSTFFNSSMVKDEILLKYHKALTETEEQLLEAEKQIEELTKELELWK